MKNLIKSTTQTLSVRLNREIIFKDIGVLYLIFALFSVILLGFFLNLEWLWGVQFISDNIFYCLIAISSKKLDPYFVTGFVDAEGCFFVPVRKRKDFKNGYQVRLIFEIHLHSKDLALLETIKNYFGVGKIYKDENRSAIIYQVQSMEELNVIILHFDKYPLKTQKWADFLLFKRIFEMFKSKEHLTIEGMEKIISIKASMNRGLSAKIKEGFPSIEPVKRPLVKFSEIINPAWLSGFVDGEGSFYVKIVESSSYLAGYRVQLRFQVTQHTRDEELLQSLKNYLGCGQYRERSDGKFAGDFFVESFSDICEKVIPFFKKYPLHGVKLKDFNDFNKVAELIKSKVNLSSEDLEQIRQIKSGMNSQRNTLRDERGSK